MSIQIFMCVCHEKDAKKRKINAENDGNKNTIHAIKCDGCLALLQFRLRYQTSNLVAVRCNKKWKIERKPQQQNIDVVLNAQLNLNCQ